ncbi:E [Phaffia rhodozyma]|uniref:glucan 1,3-beta-glucosidase n=1 Tax=Phaffia rhodozyma TaxID=264483 RepID=A0A0F7SWX9_PHARH|nr:E [Phaffia rhodozyma] [Phaffia rhodozyma]
MSFRPLSNSSDTHRSINDDEPDDGITGLGAPGMLSPDIAGFRGSSFSGISTQSIPGLARSDSGAVSDSGSVDGLYSGTGSSTPPIPATDRMKSFLPLLNDRSYSYQPAGTSSAGLESGAFTTAQAERYDSARSNHPEYYDQPEKDTIANSNGSLWARRKKWILLGAFGLLTVIVVAVAVPVALNANKSNESSNATTDPNAASIESHSSSRSATATSASAVTPSASAAIVSAAVFGTNGSTVILADGSNGFTYKNPFGGHWGYNASDPFNVNYAGRSQSWSPGLNETFQYGTDKIRGVNLGGWLNTEPFIAPALYEKYYNSTPQAKDEWTLSLAMGSNLEAEMTEHYETFITEQDFMEIAAAGFNFIRIPIGYWAIETYPGEPFLAKVSWTYFLKAIEWARKYGLRINLDLHAVPGSQNGWNHSGRLDYINTVYGQMGIANAQRTLEYIRTLTQFISQDQYKDVVPMFGIMNEPYAPTIGTDQLGSFYTEAYDLIRSITGLGQGKGPWISIHDGFSSGSWGGFLNGADRVTLDTHTYFAFDGTPHAAGLSGLSTLACQVWGSRINTTSQNFGLANGGEFSFAPNDCGLNVNGVGLGTRWEGTYPGFTQKYGDCSDWTDYTNWNATFKAEFKQFMLASMDSLQDYFFWTWKIGTLSTGVIPNPMWSYQLALAQGYAPEDPREAIGTCASLGQSTPFDGVYDAWMTGGTGAGLTVSTKNPWPPATLQNAFAVPTGLSQFTQTGQPITLPGPTYTSPGSTQTINPGNGWANAQDTARAFVKVAGCTYPDPWTAGGQTPTGTVCGSGPVATFAKRDLVKRQPQPQPTEPPRL